MKEIKYTVLYCVCENAVVPFLFRIRGKKSGFDRIRMWKWKKISVGAESALKQTDKERGSAESLRAELERWD